MAAFWILGPIMVLAALGILFVRKAAHAAMLLAVVMISLAVLYAALEAPFLFVVQIIVYTGAILMLFLFVVMLVGVDASDSVVETIRGHRAMAALGGLLLGTVLVVGLGQITLGTTVGLEEANSEGNIQGLANIMFSRYADQGKHPGPLPAPGVYARHNAVDTPALLPDGTAAESSVSRMLAARGTIRSAPALADDIEEVQRQLGVDPAQMPETSGKEGAPTSTEEDEPQ
jgi:NADH-quinone oxidoreductase subunit J